MFEHFFGFPPFGGTRNYAHGGEGPFRTSYLRLTKLVSLPPKSHQNLSFLNFKCAARIITLEGHIYIRGWGYAPGILKTTPLKIIYIILTIHESYLCGSGNNWCLPLKSTNSKAKNWKLPKTKIPWSMCSRGSSHIIKAVLVMLISGVLLSEKHLRTYQLGLFFFLTRKRYDKHPYPFSITFSPPVSTENQDLPPVKNKKKWFAPVALHLKNLMFRP